MNRVLGAARCLKCGSRHIVGGTCLMCGAYQGREYIAERICLACGRALPIVGDTCPECAAAIALGAVALSKARSRNIMSDRKPIEAAKCPGGAKCEQIINKLQQQKERKRQRNREWSKKKRAEHPEVFKEYRERRKDKIREYSNEYQKREVRKQYMREYRQSSESYRERQRGYAAKKREDPQYLEKRRQQAKEHRERERAKWLALSPEERAELKAEYRKTERYQRVLELNRAYKARLKADPERWAEHQKKVAEHNNKPEIKAKRKLYLARYYAKKRLIKENETLDKQRKIEGEENGN